MPEIRPFKGVLYNPERVRIEDVVAPPYDVIPPQEQEIYRSLSPYNIVHIALEPDYAEAARRFERWLEEGVLLRDPAPSIYVYRREYRFEGEDRVDLGFIALMRIPEGEGEVLPHEETFEGPKKDRLLLLQHVRANLSPVFLLYEDPTGEIGRALREAISGRPPRIELVKERVAHALWSVPDDDLASGISRLLGCSKLIIADGHHRFESARIYRDMMRSLSPNPTGEEGFNFVMCYFADVSSPGLLILPTHRIALGVDPAEVELRIEERFEAEEVWGLGEMFALMRRSEGICIGIFDGERLRVARFKGGGLEGVPEVLRELDVVILHRLLIPPEARVEFTRDPQEVIHAVIENPSSYGFFLNPIDPRLVKRVALAGHKMPHKSTYFYPKPLSGLVINKH